MRNSIRLGWVFLFWLRATVSVTRHQPMQSLRSTSVLRLCLSATASVARPPPNPVLSSLFCRTRSFTPSSTRWNSNTSQFYHRIIEETKEEKPNGTDEVKRHATLHLLAFRALTVLH